MGLAPGTRIGSFEIIGLIGAGGMGEVYRARDSRLGRLVAIKILNPTVAANAEGLKRFAREARSLAALAPRGSLDRVRSARTDAPRCRRRVVRAVA